MCVCVYVCVYLCKYTANFQDEKHLHALSQKPHALPYPQSCLAASSQHQLASPAPMERTSHSDHMDAHHDGIAKFRPSQQTFSSSTTCACGGEKLYVKCQRWSTLQKTAPVISRTLRSTFAFSEVASSCNSLMYLRRGKTSHIPQYCKTNSKRNKRLQ